MGRGVVRFDCMVAAEAVDQNTQSGCRCPLLCRFWHCRAEKVRYHRRFHINSRLSTMKQSIAIEWKRNQPKGRVEILNGQLGKLSIAHGRGKTSAANFAFSAEGPSRLLVRIADGRNHPGSDATIITVRERKDSFSFFLRDVTRVSPIFIPGLGVV